MDNMTRMSASAIIIQDNKILLVSCPDKKGGSFLLGPGGGVLQEEDLLDGLKREVREETGLEVSPGRMLFVEDLLAPRYRILKIWFLCDVIGGELLFDTQDAKTEGIIGVGWFSKAELQGKIVFPSVVLEHDWLDFSSKNWEVKYAGLKRASF